MYKVDNIPVLSDLIEKGIEIKLSELGLDATQSLVLDLDQRKEPQIDSNEVEFKSENTPEALSVNSDLEQAIRDILDVHMEMAWQEIKQVIQKDEK